MPSLNRADNRQHITHSQSQQGRGSRRDCDGRDWKNVLIYREEERRVEQWEAIDRQGCRRYRQASHNTAEPLTARHSFKQLYSGRRKRQQTQRERRNRGERQEKKTEEVRRDIPDMPIFSTAPTPIFRQSRIFKALSCPLRPPWLSCASLRVGGGLDSHVLLRQQPRGYAPPELRGEQSGLPPANIEVQELNIRLPLHELLLAPHFEP